MTRQNEDNNNDNNNNNNHRIRATYPLSQPLSKRLKACCCSSKDEEITAAVQLDTIETALGHLVGNSFEAIDSMYFASPPKMRQEEWFQHRLCLRVCADAKKQTLSITDYGCGMTRSDLINALGVGVVNNNNNNKKQGNSASSSDDDDEETEDEEDDEDDESTEEEEEEEETSAPTVLQALSCMAGDVGGFYAALCALGVGVQVGTKSNFDDYYEFEVGRVGNNENSFDSFVITRPMQEEGKVPDASNGFDKFDDVRGVSGTRVTISLSQRAIRAGLLDEQSVLKPLFAKLLESTPYTAAFSSDDTKNHYLLHASELEAYERAKLEQAEEETQQEEDEQQESTSFKNVMRRTSSKDEISMAERAKYIPLRLSLGERKMLRLIEAAMHCCDYTTLVDHGDFKTPTRRMHQQLKGIASVLRGLVTACDYAAGQKLANDSTNLAKYERFFQQVFEIARRHKIMNPEKMRTEYGKLIYLLQDAVALQPHLGFSVYMPMKTVYSFLQQRDSLDLLSDRLMEIATQEILPHATKTRAKIQGEIRRKERAVASLKQKYKSSVLSAEDIHLCLYSICDNNSFLNSNRVPVDKVIAFLKANFSPNSMEPGYSLSIVQGVEGARLSHSHERQYYFALQSLTLWRDIVDDMFRLWAMAEDDLLNTANVVYALQDTGQGMQRVQQSPKTYKAMQHILQQVQVVTTWVGSRVIHLGDHNVPNALSFIDKYTQVPRILGPLVTCLEQVERIHSKDARLAEMIDDHFGGLETLRKDVLVDFFRSALDGSGADNFYDAGSCIDGRLTSAWNWCSRLPDKPFYAIFKLTGFLGFDGEFK